jgi:hypothetical protein
MKKILLSLMLIGSFIFGKAQPGVVFNEFYPNPGISNSDPTKFNHEYLELYNTTGAAIPLDCYTILAYDNVNDRAYVYQLPNISIPAYGFVVFTNSVTDPLTIRSDNLQNPTVYGPATPGFTNNIYSWNQITGSDSYLKLYTRNGANLTSSGGNTTTDDFLLDPSSGTGIALFLFNGSTLVNGFVGNSSATIPSDFASITNFVIDAVGACGPYTINLSAITASQVELQSVTAATGNDNGYYRTTNGLCGTWRKSSNAIQTTPGVTNGGTEVGAFATVTYQSECHRVDGSVTYNTKIKINDAVYNPSTVSIYEDLDNSHTITAGDLLLTPANTTINDLNEHIYGPYTLGDNHDLLTRVVASQNCVIFFEAISIECISLPVSFKSFTATRSNSSSVAITWTTAQEQINKGFNIQKNVGGVWQTVAFVPSQALNGNSTSELSYSYTDANTTKGITQYRIQQVDLDGHSKYTDIRAVRGDGSVSKLVVYPNPSSDGKVNVVFEDNSGMRDVQVSDMQGKIIRAFKGISNNILVIEKLTTGFYTIKVTNRTTNASSVQKVVVK